MKLLSLFILFFTLSLEASYSNWEQVFNKDGVTVFAQNKGHRIIPFKATAMLNATASEVAKTLQDWKNKHLWSPKLKEVKLHQELANKEYIFSEYYKTPWPAKDREFLMKGRIEKISNSKYMLTANSINNDQLENKTHIQANVMKLNFLIEEVSKNKTKVIFEFHGDLKGWMPAWLVNIIQKKWPYRFIQALQNRIDQKNRVN